MAFAAVVLPCHHRHTHISHKYSTFKFSGIRWRRSQPLRVSMLFTDNEFKSSILLPAIGLCHRLSNAVNWYLYLAGGCHNEIISSSMSLIDDNADCMVNSSYYLHNNWLLLRCVQLSPFDLDKNVRYIVQCQCHRLRNWYTDRRVDDDQPNDAGLVLYINVD